MKASLFIYEQFTRFYNTLRCKIPCINFFRTAALGRNETIGEISDGFA